MPVTIMCPNLSCKKVLAVPNAARGSKVRCAYCGTVLAVPWPKPAHKRNSVAALDSLSDEEIGTKRKR